jgi:hypothetical protein
VLHHDNDKLRVIPLSRASLRRDSRRLSPAFFPEKETTMTADSLQKQDKGPDSPLFQKGRSGNPAGRQRGCRNRATLAAEVLLEGEAEALTRRAIELALEGDTTALKLCLERIVPQRRSRGPSASTCRPSSGSRIWPGRSARFFRKHPVAGCSSTKRQRWSA